MWKNTEYFKNSLRKVTFVVDVVQLLGYHFGTKFSTRELYIHDYWFAERSRRNSILSSRCRQRICCCQLAHHSAPTAVDYDRQVYRQLTDHSASTTVDYYWQTGGRLRPEFEPCPKCGRGGESCTQLARTKNSTARGQNQLSLGKLLWEAGRRTDRLVPCFCHDELAGGRR